MKLKIKTSKESEAFKVQRVQRVPSSYFYCGFCRRHMHSDTEEQRTSGSRVAFTLSVGVLCL